MQWTLNFVDQLNTEIHKNWYSTNIDKTTAIHCKNGAQINAVGFYQLWIVQLRE